MFVEVIMAVGEQKRSEKCGVHWHKF